MGKRFFAIMPRLCGLATLFNFCVLDLLHSSQISSTAQESLALDAQAALALQEERWADAQRLSERALPELIVSFGAGHANVAACRFRLGASLLRLNRYREAEPLLQSALATYQSSFGPTHLEVAAILHSLGLLYRETARGQESLDTLNRALAIRHRHLGRDHLLVARTTAELGITYLTLGQFAPAQDHLWRALRTFERNQVPNALTIANLHSQLGDTYFAVGDLKKAESLWKTAVTILEQRNSESWMRAQPWNSLGMLKLAQHRFQDAERYFLRAKQSYEDAAKTSHPDYITLLTNLGRANAALRRNGPATALFQQALDLARQLPSGGGSQFAVALECLALLRFDEGNLLEAERLMQVVLPLQEKLFGSHHPKLAALLDAHAKLLRKLNRKPEALIFSARAAAIRERSQSGIFAPSVDVRALRN